MKTDKYRQQDLFSDERGLSTRLRKAITLTLLEHQSRCLDNATDRLTVTNALVHEMVSFVKLEEQLTNNQPKIGDTDFIPINELESQLHNEELGLYD